MIPNQPRVLVTGAGGFIGHHLVGFLKARGAWVRGVDLKHPEYGQTVADEFQLLDLRRWDDCLRAAEGVDEVYALACDMGGMGFISSHHAEILHNSALISLHTLEAAREHSVRRYFFASSAMCRKVAEAKLTGSGVIDVWGDGEQTRSFCYVDDCPEGVHRLMRSDYPEPLNIGQDRMISINELVDLVAWIAGIQVTRRHVPGPMGVRGRNSDNTRVRQVLDWEPRVSLEEGLRHTYAWIEDQVRAELQASSGAASIIAAA